MPELILAKNIKTSGKLTNCVMFAVYSPLWYLFVGNSSKKENVWTSGSQICDNYRNVITEM